jgi:hypothetical protein
MTARRRVIAWALGPAVAVAATTALAQSPADVRGGADRPSVRKGDDRPRPAPPRVDRRPRGAVTPVLLIGLPAIQEELKLSDAQKESIRDLNAGFDQQRRGSADRLMKAQGGLDRGALMAMIADLRRENEEALAGVLDKSQRGRLAQVALQLEGPSAITRPEVAARLNLADTQELQIQALKAEYEALRDQLFATHDARLNRGADALRPVSGARPDSARPRPEGESAASGPVPGSGGPGPRQEESEGDRFNRASDELRARFVRELIKVLSRRQRTAFNKMLGEPFDPAKVQFRGLQGGRISLPPADTPVVLEPIAPSNGPDAAAASKPRR